MIFVVKKPFRSNGHFYNYGDIITDNDIANIKLFKSKVGFGKVIAVNEQNATDIKAYFKQKYGIDLLLNKPTAIEPTKGKPTDGKPPMVKAAKAFKTSKA